MAPPTSSTDLFERNLAYAPTHTPLPHFQSENVDGGSLSRPVIVSCMDPRIIPEIFCNLAPGDIPVIRVAAGRAHLGIQDLVILNSLIRLSEILVVHHTDCGATHMTDEQLKSRVESRSNKEEVGNFGLDGVHISDMAQSVRDDLAWLRKHPLIGEETKLTGAVFDIDTGKLERIGSA